jgi:hypothetical protein
LKTLLEGSAPAHLPCQVLTAVDAPDDAIDTYGRLVGDIEVRLDGKHVNLNQWLTAKGWTVPAFYVSMSNDEIRTLLELGEQAGKKELGFWPHLRETVGKLNFKLRYRRTPESGEDDSGLVLMPKLFRRLCTFAVNKKAKMLTGSFKAYLRGKPDAYYLLDEFLEQGLTAATQRNLNEIIGSNGALLARPQDLVFHEAGAKLIGPNGKTPSW